MTVLFFFFNWSKEQLESLIWTGPWRAVCPLVSAEQMIMKSSLDGVFPAPSPATSSSWKTTLSPCLVECTAQPSFPFCQQSEWGQASGFSLLFLGLRPLALALSHLVTCTLFFPHDRTAGLWGLLCFIWALNLGNTENTWIKFTWDPNTKKTRN